MENINATVTRFLDNRKKKKDGRFPVKLTIYYDGRKKVYKTGVDLNKDEYEILYERNLRDDELKTKRRKLEGLMLKAQDVISRVEGFTFEAFDLLYSRKKTARRSSGLRELF